MCTRLAFGSAAKAVCYLVPTRSYAGVGPTHSPTNHRVPRLFTSMSRTTSSTPGKKPDVCTLDCTGTIMRIKGCIPRLYLGVLEECLHVEEGALPGVSEQDLLKSFGQSLKRRSKELPCFGSGKTSSEEWWSDVVRSTYRGAGVKDSELNDVFDEVFEKLFHEVFVSEPAWELVPGAKEVIHDLRAWCNEADGPKSLGVISNFDERLHPLLKNLRVHDLFDFVLTSRECGSEKPAPGMFSEALKRAGELNQETSSGVHIGDNFSKDILGAHGVGWEGVLITDRDPASDEEKNTKHVRVAELVEVPKALGIKTSGP